MDSIKDLINIFYSMFVDSIDSLACSFLAFYLEMRNGNTQTDFPKWIGVDNTMEILNQTQKEVSKISEQYEYLKEGMQPLMYQISTLEATLQNSSISNSKNVIYNPNPIANSEPTFQPDYLKNFGDYKTANSTLNEIYSEYNEKLNKSITKINIIVESSRGVNENLATIISIYTALTKRLLKIKNKLDLFSEKVLDPLAEIEYEIRRSGKKYIILLFCLVFIFQVVNIFFVFFFFIKKIRGARFGSHAIWIFLLLFTVATFGLAAIAGTIGKVSYDIIPLFNYIFSEENLLNDGRYIFKDRRTAEMINICLNYGGDIGIELFNMHNNEAEFVTRLYKNAYSLIQDPDNYNQNNKMMTKTRYYIDYFLNASQNIKMIRENATNINSPVYLLSELRKWSDANSLNSYQSVCTNKTRDVWVESKSQCGDYKYTIPQGANADSQTDCLLWSEWDESNVYSRYRDLFFNCTVNSTSTVYTNPTYAIHDFYKYAYNLTNQNKKLTLPIIDELTSIDYQIQSIAKNLDAMLNLTIPIIQSFYELYFNEVGNHTTHEMFNCSFLKNNLFNIYANLQFRLSQDATSFGIILAIMSFFNIVSLISLIILVLRNYASIYQEVAKKRLNWAKKLARCYINKQKEMINEKLNEKINNATEKDTKGGDKEKKYTQLPVKEAAVGPQNKTKQAMEMKTLDVSSKKGLIKNEV